MLWLWLVLLLCLLHLLPVLGLLMALLFMLVRATTTRITSSRLIRIVHPQVATHHIVIVEVAHGRRSLVGALIFEEAEAFGTSSVFVNDDAEVEDGATGAEKLSDGRLFEVLRCFSHMFLGSMYRNLP